MEKQFEIFDMWEDHGESKASDSTKPDNHIWLEDENFTPGKESVHIKRHECLFCDAELYEWLDARDGKIKSYTYILVSNTQYDPDSYKCPRKY